MSIATILVHLDSSPRCAARLDLAVGLARRHGARLTGLFAEVAAPTHVGVVATWPSADYLAHVEAARARFEAGAAELGAAARFVDLNRGGRRTVVLRAADYAASFDLVVLGGHEPGGRVPDDLAEAILRGSGRPVLVVPPAGAFGHVGARPLFAWHRSPSAARALSDALPLIEPAAEALVVEALHAGEDADEFAEPTRDRLAAHGVAADWRRAPIDGLELADVLLNHAADHGADLLVAGAFDGAGATRFGAETVTRHLLRHMTLPVLLAH